MSVSAISVKLARNFHLRWPAACRGVLRVTRHEHLAPPIDREHGSWRCPSARQRHQRERAAWRSRCRDPKSGRSLPLSVTAPECRGQGKGTRNAEYARPMNSEFSFADVTERLLMRDDTRHCRRCVDLSSVVVPVDGPAVFFAALQFSSRRRRAGRQSPTALTSRVCRLPASPGKPA